MQEILKFTPEPPEQLSGLSFVQQVEEKLKSLATNRTGTAKPSDIQDGEMWGLEKPDGSIDYYVWREKDGSGNGTLFQDFFKADSISENPSEHKFPTEKAIADIVGVLSQELQQIAARSTLGGWTILVEPNKPLYLSLASQDANASASFLVKKNGDTAEKTPILLGYDNITGVQTSNIITILPNEEVLILELFEISANATIYAYQ